MAVRLRLTRRGKKKQPTYRVVAADSRSPRDGKFIEIIGFYDPRQEPSEIRIDNEKAVKWLNVGAQPSERVRKLLDISGAWAEFKGEPLPATASSVKAERVAPKVVTKAMEDDEASEEVSVSAEEELVATDEGDLAAIEDAAEIDTEEAPDIADIEATDMNAADEEFVAEADEESVDGEIGTSAEVAEETEEKQETEEKKA